MNRLIISLAPVGGWGRGRHNPLTRKELLKEARDCEAEGASVIHLHSRNREGELSRDTTLLAGIFRELGEETSLLIEASTGGLSDFTSQERARPISLEGAGLGSLNLGSLNFGDEVYRNSPPHVEEWIDIMDRRGVKPSLEIFDTGHLAYALSLIEGKRLRAPFNFSFIFNVKWGMVYSGELLEYLISRLPPGSNWGVIIVGSHDLACHLDAARRGADFIRVGFEDSSLTGVGREAFSNAALVKNLRLALEKEDYIPMTPEETRRKLMGSSSGDTIGGGL